MSDYQIELTERITKYTIWTCIVVIYTTVIIDLCGKGDVFFSTIENFIGG
jgi:hypothetical protein